MLDTGQADCWNKKKNSFNKIKLKQEQKGRPTRTQGPVCTQALP